MLPRMNQTRNLAARAGRWSAQHRRKAILGWLAFVIVAVVIGGSVGTRTLDQNQTGVGESGHADRVIDDSFPKKANESVLVQAKGKDASDSSFKAAVADVVSRLERTPHVREIDSPYAEGNEGQISKDGHSVLVNFAIPGDEDTAKDRVSATLDTTAAAQKANPGFRVEEFGDASADKQLSKAFEDDFKKAEVTSLPITLIILLLAFGAIVAAGVPLLLAISAVAAAIGLLGPLSHLWAVDESINSVVLLIGLAVGVDYSMFYLRREREERARGASEEAALEAAAATSGRAVLVSGFTVLIAMAGMYLAGASTFTSFATGTIMVVAIAVVGSLTVLPAVLSKLGDRVNKGRIPFLTAPEKRAAREPRVWSAVLDRVLRRPALSGGIALAILVTLAIPTLGIHTAVSGIDTLPRSLSVMKTYDRIQAAFPGGPLPATVVIEADDTRAPAVQTAISELRAKAARSDSFSRPITTDVNPDHTVETVDIPLVGDGTDSRSNAALAELRDELVPETVGSVATANVTGYTAGSKDFNDLMQARVPIVFAFVLGLAFLLLLVTFRSIVIPIKAIVLNLLSVGAAYGLVTFIFQEGHFESLLGFESNGAVTAWLPLFLFVVLFGLSMDYHVFILTRVREAYDRGMSTADAVSHGIKTTASVVSAAAIVMVAVFAIFATLSMLEFKEFGVGLAAAVLIDATIIRAVLLPAAMKLLGDWNWYLPRSLRWLPRVGRDPAHEPARA
jgi:uncharacterized membrane protein YdfJ with MMPL/SSD domain